MRYGSYVLAPGRGENYRWGAASRPSCSQNAHNKNVLVRRAQSRIDQATLKRNMGMGRARSGRHYIDCPSGAESGKGCIVRCVQCERSSGRNGSWYLSLSASRARARDSRDGGRSFQSADCLICQSRPCSISRTPICPCGSQNEMRLRFDSACLRNLW